MDLQGILGNKKLIPEAGTYSEPELEVGDTIGRIKRDRVNVPLLRKAVKPEISDEAIISEAMKLDDADYDILEETIVFDDYAKRGKAVAGKPLDDRTKFRNEFMSEHGPVFERMMNRLGEQL